MRTRDKAILWVVIFATLFCVSCLNGLSANAIAKESTLSINVENGSQALSMLPGTFDKTSDIVISANTDNYTGYTLGILSNNSTNIENADGYAVQSIEASLAESEFMSGSAYDNKWGYKPSQYITSENNIDEVIENTNYLPIPSLTGDILDRTETANSIDNNYTLSFAIKLGNGLPAGTYSYEYSIFVVANDLTYNLTYDDNSTDEASNMPSPNPQEINIEGGTSAPDSYISLSNQTPTLDNKTFVGWCDAETTKNPVNDNDVCGGNIYQPNASFPIDQTAGPNIVLYAIWTNNDAEQYLVTFNPSKGILADNTKSVAVGYSVGTLPTPTKQDRTFLGWFLEDGTQISSDYVPVGDTTVYAKWDSYNVTFNYGDKVFDKGIYLNTNVPLFSAEYYMNDFELSTDLSSTVHLSDEHQTWNTIFSNMDESSSKYPGFVFRKRIDNGNVSGVITGQATANSRGDITLSNIFQNLSTTVMRENNILNISVDGGTSFEAVYDFSPLNYNYFDRPLTIGATLNASGSPFRYINATMDNINLTVNYRYTTEHALPEPELTNCLFAGWTGSNGDTPEKNITIPANNTEDRTYTADFYCGEANTITFDANGGTVEETTRDVIPETSIGELPTASLAGYTLDGWCTNTDSDCQIIDSSYIPNGNETLYAKWSINQYTISFDVNGGEQVIQPITQDYGTAITPPSDPIREGYIFTGWNPAIPSTMPAENLTLTALWRSGSAYTITYNYGDLILNGESYINTGLTPFTAYDIHNDFGISLTIASSEYNTGQNDKLNSVFSMMDESGSPYPGIVFRRNASTYSFVANATSSVGYNKSYSGDSINVERINDNIYLNSKQLVDFSNMARTFDVPITIGATLKNNSPMRYFKGQLSNFIINYQYSNEYSVTLPTPEWPNSNCQFEGWATSKNGTPQSSVEIPADNTENLTYYPVFTCSSKTINFDANGGTVTENTRVLGENEAVGTLLIPTRTDYIFTGWYDSADGGELVDETFIPNSNIATLYAHWGKSISMAEFSKNTISLKTGAIESIQITNLSDISEQYTFASNDTTIASVDSQGNVTGVAEGETTVVLTGVTSGLTATVNIVVTTDHTVSSNSNENVDGSENNAVSENSTYAEPLGETNNDATDSSIDMMAIAATILGAGFVGLVAAKRIVEEE